jgi:hypothetical protein
MWPWVAAVSKVVAFTEFVVIAYAGKLCNSSFKTSWRQTQLTILSVSIKRKKKRDLWVRNLSKNTGK